MEELEEIRRKLVNLKMQNDVASVGAYPNSGCYKWKLVP